MLTDAACRKATAGATNQKLFDGGGLYLMVLTSNTKSWRWKYRFQGREKTLAIGLYPAVSLKGAREIRDNARRMLHAGLDPSSEKRKQTIARSRPVLDSFEILARQWHGSKAPTWTPRYADHVMSRLERNVFSQIGAMRVSEISAPQVLDVIRLIERRNANDMAHRVRMHMSEIFVYAIASGLASNDPAAIIRKALEPTDTEKRPAMLTIEGARSVLVKTEQLKLVYWATRLASRLLALTAARPGVVRMAEVCEFEQLDGPLPIWRIPAAKMKLTRERKRDATYEFVIPLSRQAVETVQAAIHVAPKTGLLFAGVGDRRKPISDSTLSKLYRQAGFTGLHVPHGWRSSFSTVMNEIAAIDERATDREIIDLMLAHIQDGVEPIYNRSKYMPRRRQIAQQWADMLLQGMPPAAKLIGGMGGA